MTRQTQRVRNRVCSYAGTSDRREQGFPSGARPSPRQLLPALLSVLVPGGTLPPPSMASYLLHPCSRRSCRRSGVGRPVMTRRAERSGAGLPCNGRTNERKRVGLLVIWQDERANPQSGHPCPAALASIPSTKRVGLLAIWQDERANPQSGNPCPAALVSIPSTKRVGLLVIWQDERAKRVGLHLC